MEVLIIIGVIILQFYVLKIALKKIQKFKVLIVPENKLTIYRYYTKVDASDENSAKIENYKITAKEASEDFKQIEESINEYLKNNKGASADMSLMKNIIERTIEKLENEISYLTPIPLYLGLIGTMFGIIIGLFSMPSVSDASFLEGKGIDLLINGVKFAMIASLFGISITSVISGIFFRKAKFVVENNLNALLTKLETKLLPHLKEDVSSNLTNLYQNLAKFNAGFSTNVVKLETIMDRNYESLIAQQSILDNIKNLDVTKFAEANVRIFEKMQHLSPQFEMMGEFAENIGDNIGFSTELIKRLQKILDKTNEISDVATYIRTSSDQAKDIQQLVRSHFDNIEKQSNLITQSSNMMEDTASTALNHFKTFMEEQIIALRETTIKEEDKLFKVFEHNRDVLDNLNELKDIKTSLEMVIKNTDRLDVDRIIAAINNIDINVVNQQLPQQSISKKYKDKSVKRNTKQERNIKGSKPTNVAQLTFIEKAKLYFSNILKK